MLEYLILFRNSLINQLKFKRTTPHFFYKMTIQVRLKFHKMLRHQKGSNIFFNVLNFYPAYDRIIWLLPVTVSRGHKRCIHESELAQLQHSSWPLHDPHSEMRDEYKSPFNFDTIVQNRSVRRIRCARLYRGFRIFG